MVVPELFNSLVASNSSKSDHRLTPKSNVLQFLDDWTDWGYNYFTTCEFSQSYWCLSNLFTLWGTPIRQNPTHCKLCVTLLTNTQTSLDP